VETLKRIRVEMLGRIEIWGHLAKHVTVYERSLNPAHSTLRKTEEYVEVIQRERPYPSLSDTSPAHGALQRLRFNQQLIPVDSQWGELVYETIEGTAHPIGWRVPLWQRGAERAWPQKYERPDLVLVSGDGQTEPVSQWLQPESIFFFTDIS
jgi:hypothetical protein